jgi:hypothetical protein
MVLQLLADVSNIIVNFHHLPGNGSATDLKYPSSACLRRGSGMPCLLTSISTNHGVREMLHRMRVLFRRIDSLLSLLQIRNYAAIGPRFLGSIQTLSTATCRQGRGAQKTAAPRTAPKPQSAQSTLIAASCGGTSIQVPKQA